MAVLTERGGDLVEVDLGLVLSVAGGDGTVLQLIDGTEMWVQESVDQVAVMAQNELATMLGGHRVGRGRKPLAIVCTLPKATR